MNRRTYSNTVTVSSKPLKSSIQTKCIYIYQEIICFFNHSFFKTENSYLQITFSTTFIFCAPKTNSQAKNVCVWIHFSKTFS